MYWLSLPRLNPKRREPLSPTAKGAARGPLPLKPPEAPSGRRPAMLRAGRRAQPLPINRHLVANERPSRTAKDAALDLRPLRPAEVRSGRRPAMLRAGRRGQPLPINRRLVANERLSRMAKDAAQVRQPLRPAEVRSARRLETLQAEPRVLLLNGVDRPVPDKVKVPVWTTHLPQLLPDVSSPNYSN